ncbi:hypothetical protein F2S73_04315 [Pseudomonas syringae pv. actinidiae]|nr:hypothetical protein [Pseudomonas syringae pv. actinidiae]
MAGVLGISRCDFGMTAFIGRHHAPRHDLQGVVLWRATHVFQLVACGVALFLQSAGKARQLFDEPANTYHGLSGHFAALSQPHHFADSLNARGKDVQSRLMLA